MRNGVQEGILNELEKAKDKFREMIRKIIESMNKSEEKELAKKLLSCDQVQPIGIPASITKAMRRYCIKNEIPFQLYENEKMNPILLIDASRREEVVDYIQKLLVTKVDYYKDATAMDFIENQEALDKKDIVKITFETEEAAEIFKNKAYAGGKGFVTASEVKENGEVTVYASVSDLFNVDEKRQDILQSMVEIAYDNSNSFIKEIKHAQIKWDRKEINKFVNRIKSGEKSYLTNGLSKNKEYLEFDGKEVFYQNYKGERKTIIGEKIIKQYRSGKEYEKEHLIQALSKSCDKINNLQEMNEEEYKDHKMKSDVELMQKARMGYEITKEAVGKDSETIVKEFDAIGVRPQWDKESINEIEKDKNISYSVETAIKTYRERDEMIKVISKESNNIYVNRTEEGIALAKKVYKNAEQIIEEKVRDIEIKENFKKMKNTVRIEDIKVEEASVEASREERRREREMAIDE